MTTSMMQPTEMLPAAAIGAMSFLLWRFISTRVRIPTQKGKDVKVEESTFDSFDVDPSTDADSTEEPGEEPSPEPSPDDTIDRAFAKCCELTNEHVGDANLLQTKQRRTTRRAAFVVLVFVLAVYVQPNRTPMMRRAIDSQAQLPADLPIERAGSPTAERPISVDLEMATEIKDPETEVEVAAYSAQEPLESEEAGEEDDVDTGGGKVVTLNLTRQRMLIPGGKNGVLYYKSAYWGIVQVGTPAVPFKVVFDTGSGHLVLPSTYCKSNACTVHKRYKRSASSSAVDIDYDGTVVQKGAPRDKLTVSFGTGEISGVFVEETVCMEDFNSFHARPDADLPVVAAGDFENGVGCMKLRMIIATDMTADPFETFKFDGVLGMGLSGLSQAPEFNFMHVVAQSVGGWGGKTPETFAFFLGENHEVSKLTLGGYEKDKVDGQLKWNNVWRPELGHWLLEIKRILVDDRELEFCKDGTCRAVVDTGTSLMAVPSAAFPEVFSQLRHKADRRGECDGPGPNLKFELEAITVVIEPQDYGRLEENKVQSSKKWPKFGEGPENKSQILRDFYCKPMLMAMDLPEPIGPKLFILGEPVLRKYYSVYDTAKPPRIGLARAMHAEWPQDNNVDDESWFYEEE